MKPNRLAQESSPYLQQHANNPVDWFPWNSEALERAKQENKPILLSIGYSTCHWCHVMAHESFSDSETAKIMNQFFINIKVDREERPDLDKIYQHAFQLLNRSGGGWPLTVFLNPHSLLPFFAGTYFPVEPRYQLPAFKSLLMQISDFYRDNLEKITAHSHELLAALTPKDTTFSIDEQINESPLEIALQQLSGQYDLINGGFGEAPKFFHPRHYELLFYNLSTNHNKQKIIEHSLTQMANGGIYDQIGGGFFRYSVDAQWHIPHFEKMLYDNAQLLTLYGQAYLINPNSIYRKVITETIAWAIREMQSPEGGFFSAIDADSEGKEGRFYVWTPSQIKSLLTTEEYEQITELFNLEQPPNFEGSWHLHAKQSYPLEQEFNVIQEKLLRNRAQRISPAIDKKILTAWNALMIKGLFFSGMYLNQPNWINSGQKALSFIIETMFKNGRLFASYNDGIAHLPAYLDDYAFLLDAILLRLQYRWDSKLLAIAIELAETLLNHFFDEQQGGFFFVADDHESLIYRPKTFADDVIPSGNGLACFVLQRLGYLLGEARYLQAVEKTLQAAWTDIIDYPTAHSSLLLALKEYLSPPTIIIIRGDEQTIGQWQSKLPYSPQWFSFAVNDTESELHPAIAEKKSSNETIAYVCQGYQCLEPITTLEDLVRLSTSV